MVLNMRSQLLGEINEAVTMQRIPSFTPEQIPEALHACAVSGVAKINGLVGEANRNQLLDKVSFDDDTYYPAEVLLPKVEDLRRLHDLINTPANINEGLRSVLGPVEVRATQTGAQNIGHIDTVSPCGITALSHISGPKALFAASVHPYKVTSDAFTQRLSMPPAFFDEYEAGDTLFIRQRIDMLDGVVANLAPMIHDGIADEPRKLLAFDFRSANLWLPPLTLTT